MTGVQHLYCPAQKASIDVYTFQGSIMHPFRNPGTIRVPPLLRSIFKEPDSAESMTQLKKAHRNPVVFPVSPAGLLSDFVSLAQKSRMRPAADFRIAVFGTDRT
jgi:hypothetical protein